jgi:hypothetical protein
MCFRFVQMLRHDVCERADKYRWGHSATPRDAPQTPFRALLVRPPHQYPLMNEKEREITAHRGAFFPYSGVQSLYVTARES